MTIESRRTTLGKVFISHSHHDKAFARQLSDALVERDYDIWLDERELVPGDDLPASISAAIAETRALVVVVSPAARDSRWLRFELSLATDRMIKGDLRLIPVVIGEGDVPPELGSLLYADFRKGFDAGLESVARALEAEHERRRKQARAKRKEDLSWRDVIRRTMSELWGGVGHMDFSGELVSRSLEYVSLSVPLGGDGRPTGTVAEWRRDPPDGQTFVTLECAFQTAPAYRDGDLLTQSWFYEFDDLVEHLGAPSPAVMVITERAPEFELSDRDGEQPRLGLRGDTYIVDLSGLTSRDETKRILTRARDLIAERELENTLANGERLVWHTRTDHGGETMRFAREPADPPAYVPPGNIQLPPESQAEREAAAAAGQARQWEPVARRLSEGVSWLKQLRGLPVEMAAAIEEDVERWVHATRQTLGDRAELVARFDHAIATAEPDRPAAPLVQRQGDERPMARQRLEALLLAGTQCLSEFLQERSGRA